MCTKNITMNSTFCLNPCSGLIVTSFFKPTPRDKKLLERQISEESNVYGMHTKWLKYPDGKPGRYNIDTAQHIT